MCLDPPKTPKKRQKYQVSGVKHHFYGYLESLSLGVCIWGAMTYFKFWKQSIIYLYQWKRIFPILDPLELVSHADGSTSIRTVESIGSLVKRD